jgi:transposase InsO family protein
LACGGAQAASETPEKRATGVSADACHAQPAQGIRDVWTWDFLESTTITGVKLRWLNVVDEYTRQCLTIKVRRSIKSEHAIDTLAELFAMYGVPKRLRCDNGPEFISKAVE